MTDRTDRIPLPAHEPRCEPSTTCYVRSKCARRHAAIPAHGAVLQDYSVLSLGGTALCPGYIDAASVRKQEAQRQVKTWQRVDE